MDLGVLYDQPVDEQKPEYKEAFEDLLRLVNVTISAYFEIEDKPSYQEAYARLYGIATEIMEYDRIKDEVILPKLAEKGIYVHFNNKDMLDQILHALTGFSEERMLEGDTINFVVGDCLTKQGIE